MAVLHGHHYSSHDGDHYAQLLDDQVDQEHIVVQETHAVVDPRAVVVVPVHALIADDAVPRSFSADDFTVGAKFVCVEGFEELHEFKTFILDIAWISTGKQHVEEESHKIKRNSYLTEFNI